MDFHPYHTFSELVRNNMGMYIGGNDDFALIELYLFIIDDLLASSTTNESIVIDLEIMPDGTRFIRDNLTREDFELSDSIFNHWLEQKPPSAPIFQRLLSKIPAFGIQCAVAIGSWCHAQIITKEFIYQQSFNKGLADSPQIQIKHDLIQPRGKILHFLPDPELFMPSNSLAWYTLIGRLRIRALIYPNLTISLQDHRTNQHAIIQYIDGFLGYFYELSTSSYRSKNVFQLQGNYNECYGTIIFQFSYSSDFLKSFANQESTEGHGSHVEGFWHGLAQAIVLYIAKIKSIHLDQHQVLALLKHHTNAIIAIQMPQPNWAGSFKYELSDQKAFDTIKMIVMQQFEEAFENSDQHEQSMLEWMLRDYLDD